MKSDFSELNKSFGNKEGDDEKEGETEGEPHEISGEPNPGDPSKIGLDCTDPKAIMITEMVTKRVTI